MKILTLDELVTLARASSPFYRELYRNVPTDRPVRLAELPVLDQAEFWAANSVEGNRVLTAPSFDGVVFKSGGTTGNPKFSAFRASEWEAFTAAFGRGIARGGLVAGERVANLFYAGEMYASFLFITKSLENSPVKILQFPLGGAASASTVFAAIRDFRITTLAGVPTSIISLAQQLEGSGSNRPPIHHPIQRILFGGESMYPDQREFLSRAFPGVRIQSIGYASVDAGLLGYVDPECGPDEHRIFGTETLFEILDEDTQLPITETGRPGRVVVTNLTRSLMPIIRYPAGDRAQWLEPEGAPDRKFLILGRAEEGARVGPVTIYFEDVRKFLDAVREEYGIANFQLLTERIAIDPREPSGSALDRLTFRIAATRASASERIRQAYYRERPMFRELVEQGKIHPLRIEWISSQELKTNARTGKLIRIIDARKA